MKKSELRKKLKKENIPKCYYSLDGGLPNEAYCLSKVKNGWEVYYSERGLKSGLKIFASETEACNYIYNLIKDY